MWQKRAVWLGGSNEVVGNLIVTCRGTTQRFWLKTVGSPSLRAADVLGSLHLFLKRLSLSILRQMSRLAERLLLPDPGRLLLKDGAITTAIISEHLLCAFTAQSIFTHVILLNPLKVPVPAAPS